MTREHVWTRLEPRPNDQEMSDALQAPVRDPLWLLSRQWQVSEFEGEDAGSPIRADLSLAEDRLSRVDLRGAHSAENDDSDPFDYVGEPLEATVEGGRVLTDDDPPLRRRAETGQQFLRILREQGYGEHDPGDFPRELRLSEPEQPLESPDRRYADLMAGRALDGGAVADAIQSAIANIDAVVAGEDDSFSGVTANDLPLPDGGSRTSTFDECMREYYGWYVDIYEEPTEETGSAWDPTRLEYDFAVATGDEETETVLRPTSTRAAISTGTPSPKRVALWTRPRRRLTSGRRRSCPARFLSPGCRRRGGGNWRTPTWTCRRWSRRARH